MSISVQPNNELQRAQAMKRLFEKGACSGGALVIDILPTVPLVIFDAARADAERLAILVDGGKMLGSSGLAFQISSRGQIVSARQLPASSFVPSQALPFKEGKAFDEFLRSAERILDTDRAAYRAIDKQTMADLHVRLDRLMASAGDERKFFNTPLGSLEVRRDPSIHALDGSSTYAIKLYTADLNRGRSLLQGEGIISKEQGYTASETGRLTTEQVERVVTLAEVRSRFG